ncbi:cytochrome C oxidase subunit IV family protein [Mycobacterium sp. HNNTM2301]|uniref:cytochrome C oxidase subunit IV family protein n=1 Tax=Mycobacterium hainanense TaxID=3289775 RepID=UPI0035A68EF5
MTNIRRITYVWIALSAITIVTWLLGHAEQGYGHNATTAVALVVLAIAFGKVYLIIRHFMEVRSGPRWLRVFTDAWIVLMAAAVLATYRW